MHETAGGKKDAEEGGSAANQGRFSDLVEIQLGSDGMTAFKLTTIGQALLTKGTTEDK